MSTLSLFGTPARHLVVFFGGVWRHCIREHCLVWWLWWLGRVQYLVQKHREQGVLQKNVSQLILQRHVCIICCFTRPWTSDPQLILVKSERCVTWTFTWCLPYIAQKQQGATLPTSCWANTSIYCLEKMNDTLGQPTVPSCPTLKCPPEWKRKRHRIPSMEVQVLNVRDLIGLMLGMLQRMLHMFLLDLHPEENWHDNGKSTIWRCISYYIIKDNDVPLSF